jgi:cytochrome P450
VAETFLQSTQTAYDEAEMWLGVHAAAFRPERWLENPAPDPASWIPFGGGVRRCAGAPFVVMEMREVLRAASNLTILPARPESERRGEARSL